MPGGVRHLSCDAAIRPSHTSLFLHEGKRLIADLRVKIKTNHAVPACFMIELYGDRDRTGNIGFFSTVVPPNQPKIHRKLENYSPISTSSPNFDVLSDSIL